MSFNLKKVQFSCIPMIVEGFDGKNDVLGYKCNKIEKFEATKPATKPVTPAAKPAAPAAKPATLAAKPAAPAAKPAAPAAKPAALAAKPAAPAAKPAAPATKPTAPAAKPAAPAAKPAAPAAKPAAPAAKPAAPAAKPTAPVAKPAAPAAKPAPPVTQTARSANATKSSDSNNIKCPSGATFNEDLARCTKLAKCSSEYEYKASIDYEPPKCIRKIEDNAECKNNEENYAHYDSKNILVNGCFTDPTCEDGYEFFLGLCTINPIYADPPSGKQATKSSSKSSANSSEPQFEPDDFELEYEKQVAERQAAAKKAKCPPGTAINADILQCVKPGACPSGYSYVGPIGSMPAHCVRKLKKKSDQCDYNKEEDYFNPDNEEPGCSTNAKCNNGYSPFFGSCMIEPLKK